MSPKPEDDEERELSGSEDDDDFDEDMEALRRACMISGTDPDDLATASDPDAGGSNSDGDDEDLELLRSISNRFTIPSDAAEPPQWMKPLCSLPPATSDDEEDDDFETLRAIQKRFAAYDNGALKNTSENTEKQEQIDTSYMLLQKKSYNDVFVDTFDVCKGLLDSEYARHTTHHLGDLLEEQPSKSIEWHHTDSSKPSMSQTSYSSFPQSARVFMDAIKKNRSFQKFLRSKLVQIEAKLEENKKLKERVKILKDFQVNCKRRTGRALSQKKDSRVQLISAKKASPSKNSKVHEKKFPAMFYGPVENSHVANYRMALTKLPLSLDRKKWSEVERKNLEKGIRQQFQEMALQIMMDQLSGTGESYGDLNDIDNVLLSIKDLDITPENLREFLPKVNWEQLASMYVVGRSGAECKARWLNFEDPLLNRNQWTAQEDKNLLFLVQKMGISNWFDVAVSLGTNRTPFQCLARYQRSLNVSILKREWTKDEDAKLRSAIEAYGEGDWQSVASVLEGWTGTQCSNRWKKSLHPTREKIGRWTADEDKRLTVAQMLFGPRNWKKTAQFVPGRTDVQCRERWVNSLDPCLNWDKWTEEEDSKLTAAIEEHGYCWSKVAAALPRRTDNMCRRRWKRLSPHEVPLLQAARKMQKAALICNFVDRESERPALGPSDFCPLPMITSTENVIHCENQTGKSSIVEKNRVKKSTENAQTGTQEGLAINNHDEVETFDGQEATTGQDSENNNLTRPGQDNPSSPLIGSENRKGWGGTDGKRKKRSCKPRSTRKEVTEPDHVLECLPLQPESVHLMSNSNGIEPLAEANTPLTKRRRVSKQKYSRNISTTNSEELQSTAMSSGRSLPTGTTADVEHQRNGSSFMDSAKLPVTHGDDVALGGNDKMASKKNSRVKQYRKRKKVGEPDGVLEDVVPIPPQDNDSKKVKPRDTSCLNQVMECLPLQPESLHLTSNGDGIEPLAEANTAMTKRRRVSQRKYSRNKHAANSEEPQSTAVSSGRSLPTGTIADVEHQHNVSSCVDSTQLLLTDDEDTVTFGGNEKMASKQNMSKKQYHKRKKGCELAAVLEDVVLVPSQDNELKKAKPTGTSCLGQNLSTGDNDIPLVCFLSEKPKRRKFQVNDCQDNLVFPLSIVQKESELFPERVDPVHDGNEMLSSMQDDALTCCDDGTSEKFSSCNTKSSPLTEEYTALPTNEKPGIENLVGGQMVACKELVEEKVSIHAQRGHDTDDISLASFVKMKSNKEPGTRACPPSSLIRGSQLLSKRAKQLQDGDYTSSVPGGPDQVTGPEVAFEKQEGELAGDDEFGDMTLSCFLRNRQKMRRLQSTK